jgi:phytoene dehydrogenase-like protein
MADVAVVGAGPNGLTAAVTMARAGLKVRVFEAGSTAGGGARTAELMEPGHLHDICSAVHPMALASPVFRAFGLSDRIELAVPEISYAHPLDGGAAAIAYQDLDRTGEGLGHDGGAYVRLMAPLVRRWEAMVGFTMDQLLRVPPHPVDALRFGLAALEQGSHAWNVRFPSRNGADSPAAAMLTGVAAHPVGRMPSLSSASAGLMLGMLAHAVGWPIPVGGSQAIIAVLVSDLEAHGGEVVTGQRIGSLSDLAGTPAVLLDIAAPALLDISDGSRGTLPSRYERQLRSFRFGNAACKVDFILSGPVPWAHPEVTRTGTIHLGGSRAQIARGEAQVAAGRHPDSPYVLVSQPSTFDPGRAPVGRHILWTYCHVPAGSTRDMTEAITAQVERFAPGFRDVVVRSQVTTAAQLASYNANYVGGDFAAGATSLRQVVARPVLSANPWKTPLDGVYLCSASTPPGPGVHGMSGFHAARRALAEVFGLNVPPFVP